MSRTENLNKALARLHASSADIEAAAVLSEDGIVIASSLPQGTEERIASWSVALHSMSIRAAVELKRGPLEQVLVKGADGYVVIMNAGAHGVLLAMARREAKLGLVFFDVLRTAEEVKKTLA
jgi:predicted regulator of Ras-like GTPase activity (Roadblock/LC7/MglB family)